MRSRRLFFVVLLVVAVVLSASVFAGFQVYKDTVETQHRGEIQQTADQAASELDARLAGHQQSVELWAGTPAISAHGTEAQREALEAFVERTEFAGASVVAHNGTMTNIVAGLSVAERRKVVGDQYGDRTYVRRALAGDTYVSEPVTAASGNKIVTVSAPVVRDGEVVATLNAAFHLSAVEFIPRATTSIEQSWGITVRSSAGEPIYTRPAAPNTSLVEASAPVAETNWTVGVAGSRTDIQPTIRRVTVLQFVGIGVVLASLAAFGWWNYRRNLQQVERLLDGFEALESGDYGVRVGIGGAAEWTRIGVGFNEMSATIEQSVAERRERRRHLEVLDRLLRHNLRNDLNVVRGRAELLRAGTDNDVDEHTNAILERCDDLLETAETERKINAVLSSDGATERVDAVPAVEGAVEGVLADYPDAAVTVDAPASVPVTVAGSLERAVGELVENAVEYGSDDGQAVRVAVETTDGRARISVSDHGPGVPDLEQQVLAGDVDIDALHHSQGLGLWLVYWTVDQSGGSLEFADDAEGAVVTVELPLADD